MADAATPKEKSNQIRVMVLTDVRAEAAKGRNPE